MKLLVTLGHNSSAILVSGTQIICGYEEERLSKVKSDSSYPKLAIEECIKRTDPLAVTEILVSHWFNDFELVENKYYQPKHLKARFKNAEIKSLTKDFTHHDAHAHSVWNFNGHDKMGLTVVADGFGNDGETFSVYRDGNLVYRHYGMSLGLMYQYATSFLGMKENQDEYKLLGMESHISQEDYNDLQPLIRAYTIQYMNAISTPSKPMTYQRVCEENREFVLRMLNQASEECSGERAAIAYFVQSVLERTMLGILHNFYHVGDKLNFAGGVFYNVKLNNVILNEYGQTSKRIEFMPLCGDQGAALGMTEVDIKDLFFGVRDCTDREVVNPDGTIFVMKGNMEFGPRALGNTSCIALPTVENTRIINKINGRPNVMPMAPMLSSEIAHKYCKNVEALGRCKHFMIVATDWTGPVDDSVAGVLHRKPCSDVYTCRPQVIDNKFTNEHGIVINTSLNAHGQPILFDNMDYLEMVRIHEELK